MAARALFICLCMFSTPALAEIVQLDCFSPKEARARLKDFGVDLMATGRTKLEGVPEHLRETGSFWLGSDGRWAYTYTNRQGLECIVDYGERIIFQIPEWARGEPL